MTHILALGSEWTIYTKAAWYTSLAHDFGTDARNGIPHHDFVVSCGYSRDCRRGWTRELPWPKLKILVLRSLFLQLVHLIFKRTETRRLLSLFVLLLAIPACLTLLYLPHASGTIQAAVKVFSLFWSTLAASILCYRISPWHPLAQYPGPLICKLSKFHLAFLSRTGKQFLYYSELHQKYGDVVRIG